MHELNTEREFEGVSTPATKHVGNTKCTHGIFSDAMGYIVLPTYFVTGMDAL